LIALLDINLLIALFDAAHVHHDSAHAWMSANQSDGWATCPIVQNGCIRVMSRPSYPGHLPVLEIARRLRNATAASSHVFWPDTVVPSDQAAFRHESLLTAKALTDVYLLALAVQNEGRLATFDRTIPFKAVAGAQRHHLEVLKT
jgi:toxin-antitoxin system PIN domain toxin